MLIRSLPGQANLSPALRTARIERALWLHLIIVYVVWGSTYLAMRVAVMGFPPFFLAAMRFGLAGTLLSLWARIWRHPVPEPKQIAGSGLMGCFLLVGGNGLVVWAEQWITSGLAALLIGTLPLFTVLLESVGDRRQNLSPQKLGALAIGFAGLLVLLLPDLTLPGHDPHVTTAAFVVLIASFSWATGTWLGRRLPAPESNLYRSGAMMLVASLGLLLLSTALGEPAHVTRAPIPGSAWGALAYLVVAGSCIGFTSFSHLTRHAEPALAASYAYVNPVVAVLLGAWLLGEPLGWTTAAGAAGIVTAIVLLVRQKRGD